MHLGQQLSLLIKNTPIIAQQSLLDCAINGLIDYFASSLQASNEANVKKLLTWINDEGGHSRAWLIGQKKLATRR